MTLLKMLRRRALDPAPATRVAERCELCRGRVSPRSGFVPPTANGFTLVEMLVAMAITLVMMAAVVTLFANVSNSVRNRRATIEMGSQLRHLRNVLQQDLQNATCPGQTWQRPESNHGYIELIEGQHREGYASMLLDGTNEPATGNPELDYTTSILPSSNLDFKTANPNWVTDGGGLGDYDDILMLTVRNEEEPFVGRSPRNVRLNVNSAEAFDVDDTTDAWGYETIESPLAEVVWFAIENPDEANSADNFFGEPGMRTIYRRSLLVAPWLNPYRYVNPNTGAIVDTFQHDGDTFKAVPGLVRVLPDEVERDDVQLAIAAIIAFQDRYDLSVRLEWDHHIARWKIMANTLADLTKRENRFGHFGFMPSNPARRIFPYAMVSWGAGYSNGTVDLAFVTDPEVPPPDSDAEAEAHVIGGAAIAYSLDPANFLDQDPSSVNRRYLVRPFAFIDNAPSGVPATAQAILNDDGEVVRVVHGPVPLWGTRRGEDVLMTDVLAFDLRVYDPGAPLFGMRENLSDPSSSIGVVLDPSDPGWTAGYLDPDDNTPRIGMAGNRFPLVGQGAYVDLGYYFRGPAAMLIPKDFDSPSATEPWFFAPPMEVAVAKSKGVAPMHGGALVDVFGQQLAPGYAVYDTWSFHYENNGVDEDADGMIDEGTDGLDGIGHYVNPSPPANPPWTINVTRLGVDDVGERETTPPYDKPLRGVQVLVRSYERDSRAIRQLRVNQHFMPE